MLGKLRVSVWCGICSVALLAICSVATLAIAWVLHRRMPVVSCHAASYGLRLGVERIRICESGDCQIALCLKYDRQMVPWVVRWLAPPTVVTNACTLPWPALRFGEVSFTSASAHSTRAIFVPAIDQWGEHDVVIEDGQSVRGATYLHVDPPFQAGGLEITGWVELDLRPPIRSCDGYVCVRTTLTQCRVYVTPVRESDYCRAIEDAIPGVALNPN